MIRIRYLLCVVVISADQMVFANATEGTEVQKKVAAYESAFGGKKVNAKDAPKKNQRALIKKKGASPYAGYKKLALIICDPSNEKMSPEVLQHLNTGYAGGVSVTMAFDVAYLLAQKAAPILICNAYVLENIFLMQHGMEAFMASTDPYVDNGDFNEEYKKIQALRVEMLNILQKPKDLNAFFTKYKEAFPHYEEEHGSGSYGHYFDITQIASYPLDAIHKDFFLYEYHKDAGHTAYLLIPKNGSQFAMDALKQHGFNAAVFTQKDIAKLKGELKKANGALDYSVYVKTGKEYTYGELDLFSAEALRIINESLIADDKNPWVIALSGHGTAYSGEKDVTYSSIAGLRADYFNEGLIPILIDKNTHFSHMVTCSIGGINRDRIRDSFQKMSFDVVPKIAQEVLGKKELKYPNNMIMVLGGISDITTIGGAPDPLPTKDFASFKKVWDRLDAKDPMVQAFMPYVQDVRYDLFFKEIIKRLQAQEGAGATTRAVLEPWKEVLKYATPYNVAKDQYTYNDIPQIRFPQHDAPFNVLDVDNRVQVLRYVDIKARELGGKLGGKGGEPIKIDNKDMVIVNALSVNVPLEISGTYPSIVSARADVSDLFFSKITCQGDKNLQNTIHALFTFEAGQHMEHDRFFLIEELNIPSGQYKDVLVENSYDYDDDEIVIRVYYRTGDGKLMRYSHYQPNAKEISITEIDITDDGYAKVYFESVIESVKLAVEEERYRQ